MSIENKQMIWIYGCIDKIIYDNKKGFMIFVLRKKTNSIIVKGEFTDSSEKQYSYTRILCKG